MTIREFQRVLVANRSEIAIRVFRACTELGIRTLGIYSKEDRSAFHRYKADETYALDEAQGPGQGVPRHPGHPRASPGGTGPTPSIPATASCPRTPDFARACAEAGIVFVGPRPRGARPDGGQDGSPAAGGRRLGIPVVPGTDEPLADADGRRGPRAEAIGYPVILKASFGGGGRGMRVCRGARRARGLARPGLARGGGRLRARRGLPREVPREAEAHRGPGPRRRSRPHRPPLRARLLGAAPPPEGGRGRPEPVPRRGRCATSCCDAAVRLAACAWAT